LSKKELAAKQFFEFCQDHGGKDKFHVNFLMGQKMPPTSVGKIDRVATASLKNCSRFLDLPDQPSGSFAGRRFG
jgi:hypothetical protein